MGTHDLCNPMYNFIWTGRQERSQLETSWIRMNWAEEVSRTLGPVEKSENCAVFVGRGNLMGATADGLATQKASPGGWLERQNLRPHARPAELESSEMSKGLKLAWCHLVHLFWEGACLWSEWNGYHHAVCLATGMLTSWDFVRFSCCFIPTLGTWWLLKANE